MTDIGDDIMLLNPDISSMFGHTHRTRYEKFREWLYDLRWHLYALREVFEKDPPSKPGLLSAMSMRENGEHWYDA